MEKKKINLIISISIIIIVLILSIFLINKPSEKIEEKIAKCIGNNAELYVQLGCHACEIQKQYFGENSKHLNIIDCWKNREKCIKENISATPTWIIENNKYIGVQSIDKLKELTNCQNG